MANPKICFVIASMKAGGQERVMSELCNWFVNNHVNVTLLLLHKCPFFFQLDKKVKIIEPDFKVNGLQRIIYSARILFFIRKNIKIIGPDSVLSFGRIHNPYVALSLYGLKIPVFVSDRGSPFYKGRFVDELLRRYTYKKVTGIISQTAFAKQYVEKTIGNKNVTVIPNPLREIVTHENIREKIIIYAGRLIPKKGVHYLIQAFAMIENNEWKLMIIGDGPMKSELKKMTHELNLEEKVLFTGSVTNIDYYFSRGEIFAFPSLSEGFPNVLAEAMANGLACISFDCITGPSELIKNGDNGYLVPIEDINELAAKLSLLIQNDKLRKEFQQKGKSVIELYNLNAIGQKYLKFITQS